jgi:hypothetical protein
VPARCVIAAVVTLAGATALSGCGDEYVRGAGVYTSTSTTPAVATATVPTATTAGSGIEPEQTTDAGGTESSEVGRLSATQRRAAREASTAARRFLAGYLPYSYGRHPAGTISSVSPELRRTLARDTPRVPPALRRKARPRLRGLKVSGVSEREVMLLARIDDGQSRYAALLTLQRRGRGWAVTQVR